MNAGLALRNSTPSITSVTGRPLSLRKRAAAFSKQSRTASHRSAHARGTAVSQGHTTDAHTYTGEEWAVLTRGRKAGFCRAPFSGREKPTAFAKAFTSAASAASAVVDPPLNITSTTPWQRNHRQNMMKHHHFKTSLRAVATSRGRETTRFPMRAFSSEQAILASVLLPTPLGPDFTSAMDHGLSRRTARSPLYSSKRNAVLTCDNKVAPLLDVRALNDFLQLLQRCLSDDELATLRLGKEEVAPPYRRKHLWELRRLFNKSRASARSISRLTRLATFGPCRGSPG